jgi:putative tryptophan/tyrosine transport system substrate-binding protein
MFSRRRFVFALTFGLLLLPLSGAAQQQTRVRRIGVLSGGVRPASLESSRYSALLQGMRELGYVEGRDFVVEWRFAEGKYDRLADYAAELVQMNVDVIVAFNTRGAVEAQHATKTIPIVFASISDPLGSGLVSNLAHPGGNITGASAGLDETTLKHLDLMRQTVRPLTRLAVLINPDNPLYARMLSRLQSSAQGLGITVLPVTARTAEELEAGFAEMRPKRVQAVLVFDDSFFISQRQQLAALASRFQLPAIAGNREYADAGLLFSYGELISDQFRRSAFYVDKIFRGAKPGDLPVEQPTRFYLAINRKTADALGLTIPPELLLRADEVIQ